MRAWPKDILILDNNAIRVLDFEPRRRCLQANLRATGREFWPTGMNVLEALKSRRPEMRTRLLQCLATLAGDNHALPFPSEALRMVAAALASGSPNVTWAQPELTYVLREPNAVTEAMAAEVRDYLLQFEASFDAAHQRAKEELLPLLLAEGGRERWPTVGAFLDELWNSPTHLEQHAAELWEEWKLPGKVPLESLLGHRAWKLFFDAWGAAAYARLLPHPQPPKVEMSDMMQLVYCASARSTVIATNDVGFRSLANAVLQRRHPMAVVVPVDDIST